MVRLIGRVGLRGQSRFNKKAREREPPPPPQPTPLPSPPTAATTASNEGAGSLSKWSN